MFAGNSNALLLCQPALQFRWKDFEEGVERAGVDEGARSHPLQERLLYLLEELHREQVGCNYR